MVDRVGVITAYAPSLLQVGDDIAKVFSRAGYEVKRYKYLVDFGTAKREFSKAVVFTPFDPVSVHPWCLMHLHHLQLGIDSLLYVTTEGVPDENLISSWVKEKIEVYACSEFVRRMVENAGIRVLGVVYHGVDFQYVSQFAVQPGPKQDGVVFGTVASNLSRKGLKKLSEVAGRVPEARFKVISTPKAEALFEGLKNVEFDPRFGKLERDELLTEIAKFDFYLCTSHSEGFCLPVLEAMALGKPVIYPDFKPISEFAGIPANFPVPVTGTEIKKQVDNLASGIHFLFHYYDLDRMERAVREAMEMRVQKLEEYQLRSKQVMDRAREFDIFRTYQRFVELLA